MHPIIESHKSFETTMEIIREVQAYPMITVKGIEVDDGIRWHRVHCPFVQVGREKIIKYTFAIDSKGNDYLYQISVVEQSFEDLILEIWKLVEHDGQCSMSVYPI